MGRLASKDAIDNNVFDFGLCSKDLADLFHLGLQVRDVSACRRPYRATNVTNPVHHTHIAERDINSSSRNLGTSGLRATDIIFICHVAAIVLGVRKVSGVWLWALG